MPDTLPTPWYRLVLYGADVSAAPVDPAVLFQHLARLGLLGAQFEFGGAPFYLPGERFLDLAVFLGCSPVIELAPQHDGSGAARMEAFCHVRLTPPFTQPRLEIGDPAVAPRCPRCRTAIADWRSQLPAWEAEPLRPQWQCPACGERARAARINWRQGAAVCRSRVELGGIHPYEAVPADELLDCLERASGQPWKYYYARP